jgi:hypothetical protein
VLDPRSGTLVEYQRAFRDVALSQVEQQKSRLRRASTGAREREITRAASSAPDSLRSRERLGSFALADRRQRC